MNGVRGLNGVFAVVRVRFCFEVVLYLQFKGGVGRSGSISLLSGSSHRRFSGSGRLGYLARWCSTAVWQAGARGFHLEVAFHRRFSGAGASRFDFVCWRSLYLVVRRGSKPFRFRGGVTTADSVVWSSGLDFRLGCSICDGARGDFGLGDIPL